MPKKINYLYLYYQQRLIKVMHGIKMYLLFLTLGESGLRGIVLRGKNIRLSGLGV